jgi:hypothetical protein
MRGNADGGHGAASYPEAFDELFPASRFRPTSSYWPETANQADLLSEHDGFAH